MLDRSTIYGNKTVGSSFNTYNRKNDDMMFMNQYTKLMVGTVRRLNSDLTVEVAEGYESDGIPSNIFKRCTVLNLGATEGEDNNKKYYGESFMPKLNSVVLVGFIHGFKDQPIVLGNIIVQSKDDVEIGEVRDELNNNQNYYFRNGNFIERKKYDGSYEFVVYDFNNNRAISRDVTSNDGSMIRELFDGSGTLLNRITISNNGSYTLEVMNNNPIMIQNSMGSFEINSSGQIRLNNSNLTVDP